MQWQGKTHMLRRLLTTSDLVILLYRNRQKIDVAYRPFIQEADPGRGLKIVFARQAIPSPVDVRRFVPIYEAEIFQDGRELESER